MVLTRSLPWFTGLLLLGFATSSWAQDPATKAPAAQPAPEPTSKVEYIQIDSPTLKRQVSVGVYLPAGYDADPAKRYPAVYFLHGMFGSEHKWEQRGTPKHLDALIAAKKVEPMIVVCPDGENSFYMKWADGSADWETFIVKDLVEAIDKKYRTLADRSKRGLSGDSMGGFGALNLGFRNPKVFGSISAHSAALLPEDPSQTPEWMKRFGKRVRQIFGDPPDIALWKANNPIHVAKEGDADALKSLAIYFDCGDNDDFGFDIGARALHEALDKRSIPHEYHLRTGDHGRDYYVKYVDFSLEFHAEVFAGRNPTAAKPEASAPKDAKSQEPTKPESHQN
jgi:S-formylglutathione hydrolase FrmB